VRDASGDKYLSLIFFTDVVTKQTLTYALKNIFSLTIISFVITRIMLNCMKMLYP